MKKVFLEVVMSGIDLVANAIDRDDVESELHDAMENFGEVTGAGTGLGLINIDLEVRDESKLNEVLEILRQRLRSLKVPRSTKIVRHKPTKTEFSIY
jgi:hypothetical protein